MSDLSKYIDQLNAAFPGEDSVDIASISRNTIEKVGTFLTGRNAIKPGSYEHISHANESLQFDDCAAAGGVEDLQDLVKACGIAPQYMKSCCESVLNIMDRCLGKSPAAVWTAHNMKAEQFDNSRAHSTPLNSIYASDTVSVLTSNATPGAEAFGVGMDIALPDLKIAVSIAIMQYHTRLLPRILPVKSMNQPQIEFVKEYLEVYDLKDIDGTTKRLIDLYENPSFAANELQKIVPLLANEADDSNPVYLVSDGILKFGVKANILKLSLQELPGHNKLNRTDLIAEGVKMESIIVALTSGETTEQFEVAVPSAINRLTRMINADDVALRNADIKFNVKLSAGAVNTTGVASTILAALDEGESVIVSFNIKPTISVKYGDVDCLGAVSFSVKAADNAELSTNATTIAAGSVEAIGYKIDARFSEQNLRKTSIAAWTHRQPFAYDIPIGRNYVCDYAIGQKNAEENATYLTKIIGIGQDDVGLRTVCMRTIEDVADRINQVGLNPEDRDDYVGKNYVAGDKVRPSIFMGTLDYTTLNIIRDADRPGDIKQKAITYLNAATSKILYDSFFLQQVSGNGITFRCVTTWPIISNVISQEHIHNHMSKDDQRNIGDGIEYVLILPNGCRLEFVSSTFDYMEDQIVMWPIIKNNSESELNFALNLDYGTMVAHYTPSGEEAHHRLFGNIREMPVVTNPVALMIDIAGMDIVNGIAESATLRPVIEIENTVTTSGTVVVSGSLSTDTAAEGTGE